jgi:hypothetical protein
MHNIDLRLRYPVVAKIKLDQQHPWLLLPANFFHSFLFNCCADLHRFCELTRRHFGEKSDGSTDVIDLDRFHPLLKLRLVLLQSCTRLELWSDALLSAEEFFVMVESAKTKVRGFSTDWVPETVLVQDGSSSLRSHRSGRCCASIWPTCPGFV